MKSRSSAPARNTPRKGSGSRFADRIKVARSLTFFAAAIGWLVVGVGVGTRVVLWPAITLFPRLREPLLGRYIRFHGRFYLGLARRLAGVRFNIRGQLPRGSILVVMNHQSIFDIPLLLSLMPASYPLVPTRDRYQWGIPGVSPLIRLARVPLITQRQRDIRSDLSGIEAAANALARGEATMAIYPEGHRTRNGEIGPFMLRGLRTILTRARPPVYCVIADGMWGSRTFRDTAVQMAGSRITATVLGPFEPPADPADIDDFVADLRTRMVAALADLRANEAADAE